MRCSYLGPRQTKQTSPEFRLFARGEFSRYFFQHARAYSFGFETSRHTHSIGTNVHELLNFVVFYVLDCLVFMNSRRETSSFYNPSL